MEEPRFLSCCQVSRVWAYVVRRVVRGVAGLSQTYVGDEAAFQGHGSPRVGSNVSLLSLTLTFRIFLSSPGYSCCLNVSASSAHYVPIGPELKILAEAIGSRRCHLGLVRPLGPLEMISRGTQGTDMHGLF